VHSKQLKAFTLYTDSSKCQELNIFINFTIREMVLMYDLYALFICYSSLKN